LDKKRAALISRTSWRDIIFVPLDYHRAEQMTKIFRVHNIIQRSARVSRLKIDLSLNGSCGYGSEPYLVEYGGWAPGFDVDELELADSIGSRLSPCWCLCSVQIDVISNLLEPDRSAWGLPFPVLEVGNLKLEFRPGVIDFHSLQTQRKWLII
jgi:hypothetical protein